MFIHTFTLRSALARFHLQVMITFTDHLMFRLFGSTWLHNVRNAGITYWVLAVADNRTADLVLASGAGQCFMAEEMEVDDLNAGVGCRGVGCRGRTVGRRGVGAKVVKAKGYGMAGMMHNMGCGVWDAICCDVKACSTPPPTCPAPGCRGQLRGQDLAAAHLPTAPPI